MSLKALFENTDLHGVLFDNTLLEEADLRTASGYRIHPELNHIRGTQFAMNHALGLLGHLDIHIEV